MPDIPPLPDNFSAPPPVVDIPLSVDTFVRQDPVYDEEGEIVDWAPVTVEAQYVWMVENLSPPKTRHWISQAHNPWDYVEKDEEVLEGLDTDCERLLCKIGLVGTGFRRGDYRYGDHSDSTQVNIPNYLYDRWDDAGILIGPPV